jgi:hypothetical protein
MPNCETHLCPLAITDTLFPLCPVEWVLERVDHHPVKDVIYEDGQLDLVFSDGLIMTIEKVGRRTGEKHLDWLEYDADEYLDAFWGAHLTTIAAIPAFDVGETCYLDLTFLNPETKNEYIAIVEFFSLYSLDQNKPITYFGEFDGAQ